MSLGSHLEQLRQKHQNLSQMIEEEQKCPGARDADIARLKKEKLRIKDEIERLGTA